MINGNKLMNLRGSRISDGFFLCQKKDLKVKKCDFRN